MENAPTILIIFGVTGDLAQKKLFPALLDLSQKNFLPKKFRIVGFSRRPLSNDEFRKFIHPSLTQNRQHSESEINNFLNNVSYEQGLFDEKNAYLRLAETLKKIDDEFGQCSNKLFYLAVPPSLYELIFTNLASSKLTIPCGGDLGWTRVLVEKPFGSDPQNAEKLDRMLGHLFKEEQIFRIDHYLAKETIQNILAFRFSNSFFQPVWNSEFIDKVEINLFEKNTAEGRGLYENLGALRDVGQNHILQMLALTTMESPAIMSPESIRKNRAKVLQEIIPIKQKYLNDRAIKGQYEGYGSELGSGKNSKIETFFSIKAFIHNKKWKGVPFYLSSGKALKESKVEIKVYFKKLESCVIHGGKKCEHQNILLFKIQPNEGISLLFWAKAPGFENKLEPKELSFNYENENTSAFPNAYERVLYDCIRGDQTLFASTEEVEAEWRFIEPILRGWQNQELKIYKRGSEGVDIN